jgi:hypothetical protein
LSSLQANEQGTPAVTVSDRVMLHVLRSVQVADIKGGGRRIFFRDIDVEQIGCSSTRPPTRATSTSVVFTPALVARTSMLG